MGLAQMVQLLWGLTFNMLAPPYTIDETDRCNIYGSAPSPDVAFLDRGLSIELTTVGYVWCDHKILERGWEGWVARTRRNGQGFKNTQARDAYLQTLEHSASVWAKSPRAFGFSEEHGIEWIFVHPGDVGALHPLTETAMWYDLAERMKALGSPVPFCDFFLRKNVYTVVADLFPDLAHQLEGSGGKSRWYEIDFDQLLFNDECTTVAINRKMARLADSPLAPLQPSQKDRSRLIEHLATNSMYPLRDNYARGQRNLGLCSSEYLDAIRDPVQREKVAEKSFGKNAAPSNKV